jgi:hypothetical protein
MGDMGEGRCDLKPVQGQVMVLRGSMKFPSVRVKGRVEI